MYYINHLRKANSGQHIVHSQFIKIARILISFIVIFVFCGTGWLFSRDKQLLLSDSAVVIASEALVIVAVFVLLIWKGSKIIEVACIQRDKAINALKENEEKFKSFVDTSLLGIVEVEDDGTICVANDQFLKITGYSRSCLEAGKLNWFNITSSDEYNDVDKQLFSEAKTVGYCKLYEKSLIGADSQLIKVKVSCTCMEDTIEPYKYMIHITECSQFDLERRSDELNSVFGQHWLEPLLDMIPAPLLLVEPGTARVTFANQAANKMVGGQFPLAQCQEDYSKFYRFTDTEGKLVPKQLEPLIRVAAGERLEGVEINWHEGDNIHQVRVFADKLPPINGYPSTCVALFQDITQLKELEESLKLGNERLNLVFETTSDLISSEEPKQLIEVLYHEIAEQLGLDCYKYYVVDEKLPGLQLISYEGISSCQARDLEKLKFGQGINGIVARERSAINIENFAFLNDLNVEPIGHLGILAYYSCPLIAQDQLLGTISFASRTRSSFNSCEIGLMQAVCNQIAIAIHRDNLINSLQKANRIKDEFLAILSHELRSPLNSILGWAQYLQVRKLDENTTSKALESIERNGRELHNVIEELLDMSRTIQGKMQLNINNCNLASIIVTVIENLRSASLAKQIDIKLSVQQVLEIDEHIKKVEFTDTFEQLHLASFNTIKTNHEAKLKNRHFIVAGDSERLRQVIWNLLSNAIKFTSCGGCIEVRLWGEQTKDNSLSYAVIQVRDTGIGINSEFLPYVFDRFRQGDSSNSRNHSGLGLGLSIVRHIVELHGGSIYVESPGEGKGSTFTVELPLISPHESKFIKKKCKEKFFVIH